ncbi:DNA-binding transcriptional LysR family regulator [Haloferula luteola]|uniref:DNA-binding transcriptional LysR family regulator n=1 Tax=Haloferula luteola TaxID=595692 RepID=A0A840UY66_9BACT|nr:LysR family transcriptional regulator [Haloferula luteola]MBB5350722.1 DNA-binding transcriptional LysR family regulator [Haloferula luteola]
MSELLPDLRQLRSFVAVADEGSFTLAAKKLYLTQSAISHSMKALEDSLGCKLLTRMGKRTTLTGEGEVFLNRCRRILGELEQASRELDGMKRWGQARIRIGAPHSLCQFLLPTVLREFRDCFPRCEPSIEAGDTAALLESLVAHDLDVVIGMRGKDDPETESRTIFRDRMIFVAPPVHPWNDTDERTVEEIEETQFIIYAKATQTYALVEKHFEQMGVRLRAPLALGDMEAIKEMSKIGIGIGIVAPWVARRELHEGSLTSIALGEESIEREWAVFWNKDRPLSLIEETLAGIAAMVGEALGEH